MAARIESNAELPVASQPTQRHRLGVRIWHWLKTVAFVALLVSTGSLAFVGLAFP